MPNQPATQATHVPTGRRCIIMQRRDDGRYLCNFYGHRGDPFAWINAAELRFDPAVGPTYDQLAAEVVELRAELRAAAAAGYVAKSTASPKYGE